MSRNLENGYNNFSNQDVKTTPSHSRKISSLMNAYGSAGNSRSISNQTINNFHNITAVYNP